MRRRGRKVERKGRNRESGQEGRVSNVEGERKKMRITEKEGKHMVYKGRGRKEAKKKGSEGGRKGEDG